MGEFHRKVILLKYIMEWGILQEAKKMRQKGYRCLVGLDEAGRGPLAGPVVAAAVVAAEDKLPRRDFRKIKDSKKLSPKQREEFYKIIVGCPCLKWGIGRVSEKTIDRINILEATKLAMAKALKNLNSKLRQENSGRTRRIDCLILDGNFFLPVEFLARAAVNPSVFQKPIVKADEKVFSCMAASIIAKVSRDRIMEKYHRRYPDYGFNRHKGYPTGFHFRMLKKYGRCAIHRKSFNC